MMKDFSVQIRQDNNDIKIVDIVGDFDCYTSRAIRQEFQKLIQSGNYNLLVNLARIKFMNVKAIKVLISIADELHKHKGEMKLCSLSERVKRLFNLIGINTLLIYQNESEALKSFIN